VTEPTPINQTTVTTRFDPSTHDCNRIAYRWVGEHTIPRQFRRYVRRHADECARELGLPRVSIRWFVEADDQRIVETPWGRYKHTEGDADFNSPNRGEWLNVGVMPDDLGLTIGIHAGLRGADVRRVVAHEVRHVAQQRDRLAAGLGEADADAYAAAYFARTA
jgi:hypothetical protein